MMTSILKTNDLTIKFQGLTALDSFNIDLKENELVALIGPNGAGKTTVFNILTGVYKQTSGTYLLNGMEVKNKKPYQLVRKGVARTFQNIRLFKYLSVLDNVVVAKDFNMKYNYFQATFRTKAYWDEEKKVRQEALELLKIFDLDKVCDNQAGSLPYGQQRKLEIARALATNPKILLLDEPAAGMNPKETEELMATIKMIKDKFNLTILLIEHDMKLVLGICERVIVLDHGKTIAQGDPKEVVNLPQVVRAYLGDDMYMEGKWVHHY